MAVLTGLFLRGGSYYLRIVLPQAHPLRSEHQSGRLVQVLGPCTHKEAVLQGTVRRAQVLAGYLPPSPVLRSTHAPVLQSVPPEAIPIFLRDIYNKWVNSKPLTTDSVAACGRALSLYEKNTPNKPLQRLTRADGEAFSTWLTTQPTASKTARDRFNWLKALLNYAALSLEFFFKNPWAGIEIKWRTTLPRKPWSDAHLSTLLNHEIWRDGTLPTDTKAGGIAAYWIPLLALYTGARCSELCQLQSSDVLLDPGAFAIRITDEGSEQRIKTNASHRTVPIHPELVRLGFIQYVQSLKCASLWPLLPRREGKAGGFFSQYFGTLRKSLSIPEDTVFHSFRHSVRTALADSLVPESTIDRILGHESGGSIGARVYTHVSFGALKQAVDRLNFDTHHLKTLV